MKQTQNTQDQKLTLQHRLKQIDWGFDKQTQNQASSQYDSSEENNQDYNINPTNPNQFQIQPSSTTSSRINGKKDIAREFQKLHQKMINSKHKRVQQHNIAVPVTREALLLKYGQLPAGKNLHSRRMQNFEGEVPSYKVDAMRLIINRIYRYLGNIFDEVQRKVMRDDIMRQRKEIFELMRPYKQKNKNEGKPIDEINDENNFNIVNQRNEIMGIAAIPEKNANKFRDMFEKKRLKIKESLQEYEMSQSESLAQLENNIIYTNSQDSLFQPNQHSIYETPGKDEIYIENFVQAQQNTFEYDPDNNQTVQPNGRQNRFQVIQFQDYNLDSGSRQRSEGSLESGRKQVLFNNRYNSDDEDQEEEKINDSQRLYAEADSNYLKDTYQTRHLADNNYEIIQENAAESTSSQNNDTQAQINMTQDQEVYDNYYSQKIQQQPAIILPPIKKQQASYLQDDSHKPSRNKSRQNINEAMKQSDLVEMSFSENPFGRKNSLGEQDSNYNSLATLKDSQNTAGQHSPDFKRNTPGLNSQHQLLLKSGQPSLKLLAQIPQNNGSKIINISESIETFNGEIQQENKKPKLKDQLLEIMTQFNKQNKPQNHNILCEDSPLDQPSEDLSLQQIDMNLQQNYINDSDNLQVLSPATLKQEQSSKLLEIKRRLGLENSSQSKQRENQYKEEINSSPANKFIDQIQEQQYQDSPIGKMLIISENEVLFEERKTPIHNETQQILLQKVRKRQKALNSQLEEIKKMQELENQDNKQFKYVNQSEKLFFILQDFQQNLLKAGFMNLIRHQLEYSKLLHLRKLKTKILKKIYFNKFKANCKFTKVQGQIQTFIDKKHRREIQAVQFYLVKWLQNSKDIKIKTIKDRNEKQNLSIYRLSLINKQKQQTLLKDAFLQIKEQSLLSKKEFMKTQKNKAIGIIQDILIKKQKKYLNKKFQKFRKFVFLLAFDQKLIKLANLLDQQITLTKKDTFKELINFCIRSDPFKKQVELLSSEYILQRNQIVYSQINRMVKLINKTHLKTGFGILTDNFQDELYKQNKLQKMQKICNKYCIFQMNQQIALRFKIWHKVTQTQTRIALMRAQSLKKIKMLLNVFTQRNLKQKFDTWKSETSNYLKYELTKFNQEQTVLKNSKLEQILIDRLWSHLNSAFQSIKMQAKIKKSLDYILRKNANKKSKIEKQQAINKWRNQIFKLKMRKISLTVLIKNLERKYTNQLQISFKRWLKIRELFNQQRIKIHKVMLLVNEKEEQQNRKMKSKVLFKLRDRVQVCKIFKQIMNQFIIKKEQQQVYQKFQEWKNNVQTLVYLQQKALVILSIQNRLSEKKYFTNFKTNSKILSTKLKSINILAAYFTNKQVSLKVQTYKLIKDYFISLKVKKQNYSQALKILKRLNKTLDYKAKQRFVIKWKLNTLDSRQKFEKQAIKQQYVKKVLLNIFGKQMKNLERLGFFSLKNNVKNYNQIIKRQQIQCKALDYIQGFILRSDKSNLRYSFLTILKHSNEIEQNFKVNRTISKLTSATKICEYFDKSRRDREFFYKWKNQALRIQAYEFGFQVLTFQFQKHMKDYLQTFNNKTQAVAIQRTRQKIGLNMLKMILFKSYKNQIQKAYNIWLLQSQQITRFEKQRKSSQPPLPPRTQVNIIENSQKKKKVELLFTLPPMSQRSSVNAPKRLFSNHSKSNSGNNSVTSQKNSRYSQQDEEEDDHFYDYEKLNLDTNNELNNSSEQLIVIKPKMSFGPMAAAQQSILYRDSKQSNRSVSNTRKNRYDESSDNSYCEEFKIAPLTSKNDQMRNSLFQFLQDEGNSQNQVEEDQELNIYGLNKLDEKAKVSVSPIKKRKSNFSGRASKVTNQSRNSKVGGSNQILNKYLSQNSQSKKKETAQKRTSSARASQKQQNRESTNTITQNIQNIKTDEETPQIYVKTLQYKLELLSDTDSCHQQIFNPQQSSDEETLQNLLKNQSQSKLLSPRELEPVLEVEEMRLPIVNNTSKQTQSLSRPRKAGATYSANTNLSNFLNSNTRSTSRTQQDKKVAKQKSKENNEKFKVFLNKSQNRTPQNTSQINLSQNQQQVSQAMANDNNNISIKQLTHTHSSMLCSSNPLSYTTSIDKLQLISGNPSIKTLQQTSSIQSNIDQATAINRLNQFQLGLNRLSKYFMKKYMIKVAEHAYSPEQDEYYKYRIIMKIKGKIQRVINIKEGLKQKPDYLKQEAFLTWKRMDYLIMLESLNMFRNNISQFYQYDQQ